MEKGKSPKVCSPLLVLGKTGTLGKAISHICEERNIHHLLLSRTDLDITNKEQIKEVIAALHPWGIINTTGYLNVEDAEHDAAACMNTNCYGPAALAEICREANVQLLSFSTDLVFNGLKESPYIESDEVTPLNLYGHSKAMAEKLMLKNNERSLIIRTSSFFGPWDLHNFVTTTLATLRSDSCMEALSDVFITPTYVPDLAHVSLDLLLDREQGIFHVTNGEVITWAELARRAAIMAGYNADLITEVSQQQLKWRAKRPHYSALQSERGISLPTLTSALERYLEAGDNLYRPDKIAV